MHLGPGNYHVDVATPVVHALSAAGLKSNVTGGGRITRDDEDKSVHIYGFSYGFGKADHARTSALCKQAFPDYAVSWSDEGY